jgi:hypothetical protein
LTSAGRRPASEMGPSPRAHDSRVRRSVPRKI